MTTPNKPAVVLLSGGLDSATALAVARHEGYRCYALTLSYGQRHVAELAAARNVAAALGAVEQRVMQLDLRAFATENLRGVSAPARQWCRAGQVPARACDQLLSAGGGS